MSADNTPITAGPGGPDGNAPRDGGIDTVLPARTEQRRGAVHERRLAEIWEAVHGAPPDRTDPQWDLARRSVAALWNDTLTLLASSQAAVRPTPPAASSGRAIAGSPTEVELSVAAQVETSGPEEVQAFLRESLVPTVVRLEREGVSRESITDILTRVLRVHPDPQEVARISVPLLGYLAQEWHVGDPNYLLSIGILADILTESSDPSAREAGLVAYHLLLRGLWLGLPPGDDDPLEPRVQRLIGNNTANLATEVYQPFRGDPDLDNSEVRNVCRTLVEVSAVCTEEAAVLDPETAVRCLELLGFRAPVTADARLAGDLVAVLRRSTTVSAAWTADHAEQARLEVCGAVADALIGDEERSPAQLFNAGVSLGRSPEREHLPVTTARMLYNLGGLYWGLALITRDGAAVPTRLPIATWSCGVNFAAAAADHYGRTRTAADWEPVLAIVRAVFALQRDPEFGPLLNTNDRFRMTGSARTMKLDLATVPSLDRSAVLAALAAGLAHLTGGVVAPDPRVPLQRGAFAEQAARIGGYVGDQVLQRPDWPLADELVALARRRGRPAAAFRESYALFGDPVDGSAPVTVPTVSGAAVDVGVGPLVRAGVMDLPEWQQRVTRLLRDPGSIEQVVTRL